MFELFFGALIVFLIFVAPIWIIAHYVLRWRTAKVLSAEEEKMLGEFWEQVQRMESRVNTLERILDADAPDWRKQL